MTTKPKRAIVNFVTRDERYMAGMGRLRVSCDRFAPDVAQHFYIPELLRTPPHSGPGMVQYGFKPCAIMEATYNGQCDTAIWCDASVVLTADPTPAFEFVEEHGYAFAHSGFSVADWTSDRCLAAMKMSREEAKSVPMIAAICMGFSLRDTPTRSALNTADMLLEWKRLAWDTDGPACFNGSHRNDPVGIVSADPACRGHRHDQSVLSILAHRYGLPINHFPHFAYATPEGRSPREGVCLLGKGC